jgi:PilZ domain
MKHHETEKRKEIRYPIEAEAKVELVKGGQALWATTENLSESGALLHFEEPTQLAVGDEVNCEFTTRRSPDKPLPCWGMGRVVRVDASRAGVELSAAGFDPTESPTPEEAAA